MCSREPVLGVLLGEALLEFGDELLLGGDQRLLLRDDLHRTASRALGEAKLRFQFRDATLAVVAHALSFASSAAAMESP